MTKSFKTLDDMGDVTGKRVLVRVDLNVPMADLKVTDDTRLRATLPTVTELADRGAIVLLLAPSGAMLPVMARRGEWIQVRLSPQLRGVGIPMRWYKNEDRGWMHDSTVVPVR